MWNLIVQGYVHPQVIGTTLFQYKITAKLDIGGMGKVFEVGFTLILVSVMASWEGTSSDSERPVRATLSYLGQPPPIETLELFAPDIVNTDVIEPLRR
jgi:hypothetical protein